MKNFWDLTDEEVLALTDAEVEYYRDRECAEKGVPLLPPNPGPAPEMNLPKPDTTAYEIDGCTFANQDDAMAHHALVRKSGIDLSSKYVGREYGSDTVKIAGKKAYIFNVQPVEVYSSEQWNEIGAQFERDKAAKAEWQKRKDDFDETATKRREATEDVDSRIAEARSNSWEKERALANFNRYLALADGDDAMARKFFTNAYPEQVKWIPVQKATPAEAAL